MTFLMQTLISWLVAFFIFEKLIIGKFLYHSFANYYYLYEIIFWTFTFAVNYGVKSSRIGYFFGGLLRLGGIYFSSLCSYHIVVLFKMGINSWLDMMSTKVWMVIFVPSCLPAVLIGLGFILSFDLSGLVLKRIKLNSNENSSRID